MTTKNSFNHDVFKAIKYHYGNSRSNEAVRLAIEYHCMLAPSFLNAFHVVNGMFSELLDKNTNGRFLRDFTRNLSDAARTEIWFGPTTREIDHDEFIFDVLVSTIRLTEYVHFGDEYANVPDPDPQLVKFMQDRGYPSAKG